MVFVTAHRWELALAAWLVLSAINGLLPYASMRNGPAISRAFGFVLDLVAGAVRRDSPGSLALPLLQRSREPTAYRIALPEIPARHPRGDAGFAALGVLVAISGIALALTLFVAAASLGACSGRQRPWTDDARLSIVGVAHAVDAADALVAARYDAESAHADMLELVALEHRYAPIVDARHVAREQLLAAEAALDAAVAADGAPARCRASHALSGIATALRHEAAALDAAHLRIPDGVPEAIEQAMAASLRLLPNCGDSQ